MQFIKNYIGSIFFLYMPLESAVKTFKFGHHFCIQHECYSILFSSVDSRRAPIILNQTAVLVQLQLHQLGPKTEGVNFKHHNLLSTFLALRVHIYIFLSTVRRTRKLPLKKKIRTRNLLQFMLQELELFFKILITCELAALRLDKNCPLFPPIIVRFETRKPTKIRFISTEFGEVQKCLTSLA